MTLLLQERHVLERALHAEVAAGDHEAVERVDDLVEVVDRLRLLDLGDDREVDALLVA